MALRREESDLYWQEQAACKNNPFYQHALFPETEHDPLIPFSKNLCRACPVRSDCTQFAWRTNQEYGTWGGTTEWERRRAKAFQGLLTAPSIQPSPPSMPTTFHLVLTLGLPPAQGDPVQNGTIGPQTGTSSAAPQTTDTRTTAESG
jgi:WhiB family redox-sensing transcriptional regulator